MYWVGSEYLVKLKEYCTFWPTSKFFAFAAKLVQLLPTPHLIFRCWNWEQFSSVIIMQTTEDKITTAMIIASQNQDYVDEGLAEYQDQIHKLQSKSCIGYKYRISSYSFPP